MRLLVKFLARLCVSWLLWCGGGDDDDDGGDGDDGDDDDGYDGGCGDDDEGNYDNSQLREVTRECVDSWIHSRPRRHLTRVERSRLLHAHTLNRAKRSNVKRATCAGPRAGCQRMSLRQSAQLTHTREHCHTLRHYAHTYVCWPHVLHCVATACMR